MPVFAILVKGRGIRVSVSDGEAVGFLRWVRVADNRRERAEARAIEKIKADWDRGAHARVNRGAMPRLTIDQTVKLPWWRLFVPHRSGYIFVAEDDDPPAPNS